MTFPNRTNFLLSHIPPAPPSPLRLKIDKEALAGNWRALNQMSGKARAGAAVKANAYGTGVSAAVPALKEAGCRDFFVAHWSEAAGVLAYAAADEIAVLHGPLNDADVAFAKETGVRPVLNSLAQVQRWMASGGGLCDLMVDTGMNRLGLPMASMGDPLVQQLDVVTCLSHLASADEDVPQNAQQRQRFAEVRGAIAAQRYSLANSAGIALGEEYHADLTRPGLALYGGIARPEYTGVIRQVAYPEAAVLQVREIAAGDPVGYNATFIADRPMRVGAIALGYADGYLRCWSGKGSFHWRGVAVPSLGRISMDMTVVDLTQVPDCGEGDWLSVDYDPVTASAASGLSQYELLTLLGQRFASV